jgi:glucose-1-phosphate adenylyltransferase
MVQPRVLVVVLAGGAGSRLELLTRTRAKPALSYGGHYRLVDIALSNCLHSGFADVWVVEQNNPVSLADHLNSGRPWDLDRTRGGLLVLHPRLEAGSDKQGWHQGTADALWRHTRLIREFGPEALVVLSADAVYALDYEKVVSGHLASDAHVTMVTTRVAASDASRYGVVEVEDGRVTEYAYKPDDPASDLVTNEVFVFTPGPVLDLLDELGEAAGDDGLEDLGDDLLPRLVADGRAREHRFDGYWRDLGTVEAYWQAAQDLVRTDPPYDPGDRSWPLTTVGGDRAAARVRPGAGASRRGARGRAAVAGLRRRRRRTAIGALPRCRGRAGRRVGRQRPAVRRGGPVRGEGAALRARRGGRDRVLVRGGR